MILDATFLAFEQRAQARALAERLGAAFVIVDFRAHAEPLQEQEQAVTFDVDSTLPGSGPGLDARWALLLHRVCGPVAAAAVDQS